MTQQFDFLGVPLDEATTRRIDLPQPREVRKPRLRDVFGEALAYEIAMESALCSIKPRAISLRRASWSNRDEAVTCPRCLKLIAERARSDHR